MKKDERDAEISAIFEKLKKTYKPEQKNIYEELRLYVKTVRPGDT